MPQWLLPLRVYGLILGLHPLWSAKPAAGQRSWTQGKRTGHKLGAAGQLCIHPSLDVTTRNFCK